MMMLSNADAKILLNEPVVAGQSRLKSASMYLVALNVSLCLDISGFDTEHELKYAWVNVLAGNAKAKIAELVGNLAIDKGVLLHHVRCITVSRFKKLITLTRYNGSATVDNLPTATIQDRQKLESHTHEHMDISYLDELTSAERKEELHNINNGVRQTIGELEFIKTGGCFCDITNIVNNIFERMDVDDTTISEIKLKLNDIMRKH